MDVPLKIEFEQKTVDDPETKRRQVMPPPPPPFDH
jgi:hypothetical protein